MPELILCHSHRALRSWLHFSFKFQIIYPFPSFVNYSSSTSRRCLCVSKFSFASLLPSSIHFHIFHWIWWLNASGSPSIQFGRRCVVSIVDSLSLCISFFFLVHVVGFVRGTPLSSSYSVSVRSGFLAFESCCTVAPLITHLKLMFPALSNICHRIKRKDNTRPLRAMTGRISYGLVFEQAENGSIGPLIGRLGTGTE